MSIKMFGMMEKPTDLSLEEFEKAVEYLEANQGNLIKEGISYQYHFLYALIYCYRKQLDGG